ncbi:hypothetical protein C8R42DRAFT_739629 [Lentinula raphanica]|nr:hypothetical protein C8R42DRAFT_739629 [Lentinula raphanica]
MVYTRSMFTTLLVFGAASFVVVSAVPIDTNSGPSPTITLTSDSHTPTSTSLSAAAASSTLLDLSGVAPLSQAAGDLLSEASSICTLSLTSRHQRRAIADNYNGGNGGEQGAHQQPAVNGRTPSPTELDRPLTNHDSRNGGQSQDAQPQPAANGRSPSPTEPYDIPPSVETRVPAWAHEQLRTLRFTRDGFAIPGPQPPVANTAQRYPFLYGDGQTRSPGSNARATSDRANQ